MELGRLWRAHRSHGHILFGHVEEWACDEASLRYREQSRSSRGAIEAGQGKGRNFEVTRFVVW